MLSRNHLDQNYKLSPHRLIFDGGVGAQQSEAENAVEDERARDACFSATQTDSPPHLDVRVPGRSWAELGRTRPRFGLPAHGEIILQPKGDGKGSLGDYYSIYYALNFRCCEGFRTCGHVRYTCAIPARCSITRSLAASGGRLPAVATGCYWREVPRFLVGPASHEHTAAGIAPTIPKLRI
jgi:hypothetical protein